MQLKTWKSNGNAEKLNKNLKMKWQCRKRNLKLGNTMAMLGNVIYNLEMEWQCWEMHQKAWKCYGNPGKCIQILENMITNAQIQTKQYMI